MSTDDGTTQPDGPAQPAPEHPWPTSDSDQTGGTPTERIATGGDEQPDADAASTAPRAEQGSRWDGTQPTGASSSPSGSAATGSPGYGPSAPEGTGPGYPGGSAGSGYGNTPGYGSTEQPGYPPAAQPGYGAPGQTPPGYDVSGSTPFSQPGYSAPGQPGYSTPGQPGYSASGQPAPAWPGDGTPGYPPPGAGYAPYPGPASSWDGVSIAAFVTAVLGMAVVPLVLGIIGNRRTQRNRTQGRWMALVGIVLGALQIVAYLALAVVLTLAISHDRAEERAELDALHSGCAAGSMADCDDLYWAADIGSDEEEFADTCGGLTTNAAGSCYLLDEDSTTEDDATSSDAQRYGDDPELDALWDACAAGDGAACDSLYIDSPVESEYEEFRATCGNRLDDAFLCEGNI
ncbi:DUF4190 domain-containing protein [Cellulomonas sp. NPDC089187]|uniref:DUF4190 domain-containing protein n=1 Tax=Cellulomonas sp. NPDC089187 TaxID=3154970 RepID=UPI003443A68F